MNLKFLCKFEFKVLLSLVQHLHFSMLFNNLILKFCLNLLILSKLSCKISPSNNSTFILAICYFCDSISSCNIWMCLMLFSNWQFLQLFFKISSSLLSIMSSFSLYFMLVHKVIIAIYQLTYGSSTM